MIVSHLLNKSKYLLSEKNPRTPPVVWFTALVYFATKIFPLCQAEEISMQEVVLQQQEVGFTDIYH